MDLNDKLKQLEARALAVKKTLDSYNRDLAVLEHKRSTAIDELKKLGVDVEGMKIKELKELQAKLEEELADEVEKLEKNIDIAEGLIEEFSNATNE